jgi:hypothetical protein
MCVCVCGGGGGHMHIKCGSLSLSNPASPLTRFELCPADRVSQAALTRAACMYNNRQFNKPPTNEPLISALPSLYFLLAEFSCTSAVREEQLTIRRI